MSFVASDWMPRYLVANCWDNLSGFVATKLMPGFAASGGVVEGIKAVGGGLSNPASARAGDEEDEKRVMEAYGMTRAQKEEVQKLGLKMMFTETTSGANDEALLCSQKSTDPDEVTWGVCNDYRTFVPALAEKWEAILGGYPVKLRIRAFFAENDALVGEGGRAFWTDCWGGRRCGDGVEYTGRVVGGTTHDSIGDPENGVLEEVLGEARRALVGEGV